MLPWQRVLFIVTSVLLWQLDLSVVSSVSPWRRDLCIVTYVASWQRVLSLVTSVSPWQRDLCRVTSVSPWQRISHNYDNVYLQESVCTEKDGWGAPDLVANCRKILCKHVERMRDRHPGFEFSELSAPISAYVIARSLTILTAWSQIITKSLEYYEDLRKLLDE